MVVGHCKYKINQFDCQTCPYTYQLNLFVHVLGDNGMLLVWTDSWRSLVISRFLFMWKGSSSRWLIFSKPNSDFFNSARLKGLLSLSCSSLSARVSTQAIVIVRFLKCTLPNWEGLVACLTCCKAQRAKIGKVEVMTVVFYLSISPGIRLRGLQLDNQVLGHDTSFPSAGYHLEKKSESF